MFAILPTSFFHRLFFLCGATLLLPFEEAMAQGQFQCACDPPASGTAPCCIGQWSGPYYLAISCHGTGTLDCDMGCSLDEIVHAVMIPEGTWQDGATPHNLRGRLLIWTRCDKNPDTALSNQYTTHVWDPSRPTVTPEFHPPIVDELSNPEDFPEEYDGPFCAAHVWMLDEAKSPVLVTVGGTDRGPETWSGADFCKYDGPFVNRPGHRLGCGLPKVYWFDPNEADPDDAWSDMAVPDLIVSSVYKQVWYPSILSFFNPNTSAFEPMVLGGGGKTGPGCGTCRDCVSALTIQDQYFEWWTHSDFDGGEGVDWLVHEDASYGWHMFPRPFQVSNAM